MISLQYSKLSNCEKRKINIYDIKSGQAIIILIYLCLKLSMLTKMILHVLSFELIYI